MPAFRFHESLQRGSPDFPLEYYLLDNQHSRYEMSFHWHEEVELIRILSGEFSLSLDEKQFRLTAGDMAFIPSGCLHGGTPTDAVYECIVFDMRFLLRLGDACRKYVGDILHRRIAVQSHFPAESPISLLLSPMFDALRFRYPGCEAIAAGCLLQFIGDIFRLKLYQESMNAEDCRKVLQLKKVFELIESQYASPCR